MANAGCPNCGHPAREGARFCPHCGAAVPVGAPCPKCGSAVGAGERFCSECGQAVQAEPGKGPSLFDYFVKCLKNYANFEGRARRKEFWSFVLFSALFGIVLWTFDKTSFSVPVFSSIYSVLTLLPSLAVTVRRLHDTGKSGWCYPPWLIFVAFFYVFGVVLLTELNGAGALFCFALVVAGCVVFLVVMAREGDAGQNRYGPSPKDPAPVS